MSILDAADILQSTPDNMYDIFDQAGTTRMGKTEKEGVVDRDLRMVDTASCYVLSSSVFPTLGTANPTFTLMALAVRLARHLAAAYLKKSPQ